jgi:Beta-propeller repeat/Cep192 domain 4/Abnormal spindle-like microcephaly-assoc'd, ASPM-SPD-2-Hydin/HYDIN/CFA65/VesB-like, Ig-like domain
VLNHSESYLSSAKSRHRQVIAALALAFSLASLVPRTGDIPACVVGPHLRQATRLHPNGSLSATAIGRVGEHAKHGPLIARGYGALPLQFESNRGQFPQDQRFLARGAGYSLLLGRRDATLLLRGREAPQGKMREDGGSNIQPVKGQPESLGLEFLAGNSQPKVEALGKLPTKVNYFHGANPHSWFSGIPAFSRVRYKDIYPGIDLVYYGRRGHLETDFQVQRGANPESIGMHLAGAREMRLDAHGDLIVSMQSGQVALRKPLAYQPHGADRQMVSAAFQMESGNVVKFQIGSYDRSRELVIDPVLDYSTYLGGTTGDEVDGIAVDSAGDAYVVGTTFSTDFPATMGVFQPKFGGGTCAGRACYDVFVAKVNPAGGALVYATYLGGTNDDTPTGIAIDAAGNAFVVGTTSSTDFPTTPGAFQTALNGSSNLFVTELAPDAASLVYSTYLGGTGTDTGGGIAVDSAENAYVTGSTNSVDFPVANGAFQSTLAGGTDALFTKVAAGGASLLYSSYLGGSGADSGSGVAVDGLGMMYLTGSTSSTDFPLAGAIQSTLGGGTDAFVTRVAASGSKLSYSTYLGGAKDDSGVAIAVTSQYEAFVVGTTASSNFPTHSAIQPTLGGGKDIFVSAINPTGTAMGYSTYLGGSGDDSGGGIAVDSSANAYIAGQTNSADFPLVNAIQQGFAGPDASLTELKSSGTKILFSSYFGGANSDTANGIGLDGAKNIYIGGGTQSTDLPISSGAFLTTTQAGITKGYVAKILPADSAAAILASTSLTFTGQSTGTISQPQVVKLSNEGSGSLTITNVAINGDFSQTNSCGSVVAGGTACALDISFSPTARGNRKGTVTISDNAANSPQKIALSGTGIVVGVTLSPQSLTFASQNLNTTSTAKTVTLTNSGQDPLDFTGIVATGDFVETNTCGSSLAAGANCTVSVKFTPSLSGTRTGSVLIVDNAPGSPQTIALTGTGVGPNTTLTPASLIFSDQPVGTTSGPQDVTLTNSGNAPLNFNGASVSGAYAQTNNCGAQLAAGSSCEIHVVFKPTAAGTTFGALTIADNAPGNPQVLPLSGNGVAGKAPTAYLSTTSLSLGLKAVGNTSSAQTVDVTNTGNDSLSISSVAVTGPFAQTNTCATGIGAGAKCAISVTFSPAVVGVQTGTLSIADNASGSPQVVALAGVGTDFGMTLNPPSATVTAGQSATFTLTITPAAGFNQPVSIDCSGSAQATTCAASPSKVTLDGTNPATVQISVSTTSRSGASPLGRNPFSAPGKPILWLAGLLAITLMILAARSKHVVGKTALAGFALMLVLVWAGCNVGSKKITGTVAGSYQYVVTASDATTGETLSHQVAASVVVN